MTEILWLGDAAPPALLRKLKEAGITPRPRPTAGCVARVIARRSLRPGEVTQGPGAALPLVWLGRGALDGLAVQQAVVRGAYDAFSRDQPDVVERLAARLRELCTETPLVPEAPEFVTVSPAGARLLGALYNAARTGQPVLLTGETGTGKEVAARLIHRWSSRHAQRFVPINCAAIPNELMESELFGYARGAFSGAVQRYDGQIMAAQGGTVFLDEIDDTPVTLQNKLLRVLEDHVVSRLGENEWHRVDFRLIAATNRDLRPLIAAGQFGGDLFERLAIVAIQLPPLRERAEDLPALTAHFIARFYEEEKAARARGVVTHATPEALAALQRYPWPGNVRELRNVIFNALVGKRAGTELLLSDLPRRVLQPEPASEPAAVAASRSPDARSRALFDRDAISAQVAAGTLNLRAAVDALEKTALACALARADGSAAAAARLLGEVGRGRSRDPGATVRAMMRRHGL